METHSGPIDTWLLRSGFFAATIRAREPRPYEQLNFVHLSLRRLLSRSIRSFVPSYTVGIRNGGQKISYGISIAFVVHSLDHSLFTRLIPPYTTFGSRLFGRQLGRDREVVPTTD